MSKSLKDDSKKTLFDSSCFIHLSGGMTGYPDYQIPLFDKVQEWCYRQGARYCYSPAAIAGQLKTHEQYMRYNLSRLITPPAARGRGLRKILVLLPDWQKSEGAALEHAVAKAIGLERLEVRIDEDDRFDLLHL